MKSLAFFLLTSFFVTLGATAVSQNAVVVPSSNAQLSATLSFDDAEPRTYHAANRWYVWTPAKHLAPKFAVEDEALVLASNGSENCIGKWAIELSGLSPGQWYRVGASYLTEQIDSPDQSVIGVTAWLDDARALPNRTTS